MSVLLGLNRVTKHPRHQHPRVVSVGGWVKDVSGVGGLYLLRITTESPLSPEPPQFGMVWVPGMEAVPMTLIPVDMNEVAILVRPVGSTTKALSTMRPGKRLRLIGPSGRGLRLGPGTAVVTGGSATAVGLAYAYSGHRGPYLVASRRAGEALALRELFPDSAEVITACEDGGCDFVGTAVEALREGVIGARSYLIAGPKPMLRGSYEVLWERGALEASYAVVEVEVRCGTGACGLCRVPGTPYLLCVDGPALPMKDLGTYLGVSR